MKLQYLAIIFLIIILPIVMVLSIYVDYHIDAINMKHTYDTKLLDATYDALKSYQLNTVNNAISDISASKIEELEAAVKAFYNSLSTTYGYTGYKSSVMEDYVPAVVFAMYDGYYIYSPYRNVLTGVSSDDVDEAYEDNKILKGLKSYVYYSCRYKKDLGAGKKFDVVITYTLDNYITIQGTVNGKYINKYGYLIDGIIEDQSSWEEADINNDGTNEELYNYTYDGITYTYSNKNEELKEYLGDTEYSYVKINGTKYYLSKDEKSVFYINASGEKAIQASTTQSPEVFEKYKNFIKNNNSAYRYYRESYNFTKWVRDNLGGLSSTHALDAEGNSIDEFADYTIFGEDENDSDNKTSGPDSNKYIQDLDSDFNAHRSAVIRYTITKNLSTAIAGYNNYFNNSEAKFIMPNISETDWEIIENNISMITFLQGFKIGGRDYNEYCVVANNLNKEFVSEDDIYVLGNDYTYYKVNDKTINDLGNKKWFGEATSGNKYAPGVWKLNFENKIFLEGESDTDYKETKYFPISYKNNPTSSTEKPKAYIGSYSSVIASTSVDTSESDMYKYMRNKADGDGSPSTPEEELNAKLKTVYYTALARERYGQYSVNNEIDIKPGELTPPAAPNEDKELPKVKIEAYKNYIDESNKGKYYEEWTKEDITIVGIATDNVKIASYGFEPHIQNIVTEQLDGDKKVKATYTKTETTSETGNEYIFWANDSSDNPGESNKITIKIDKLAPTINISGNETEGWNKNNVPITVSLSDEHSGLSGYVITDNNEEPSDDKYIKLNDQELKNLDLNLTISDDGKGDTIKSGSYIHIKDNVGNVASKQISAEFDKTKPTVDVTPTSSQACKNTQITITLIDSESGLESEEGICYLSKYNEEIDKTEYEYYEYKSGETFTIGESLTGVYELWVEDVSDRAGNTNEKHLIGEFIFDNEAPTVEVTPTSANLCKNTNITIKLKDNGSGLKSEQGIYYLSLSKLSNDKSASGKYTSNKAFTAGANLTGTYYLWVGDVEDNAGNINQEHCVGGPYVFDNAAPTISSFKIKESNDNSISVEVLAVDVGGAGIASYKYYILNPVNTEYILSGQNDTTSTIDSYTYKDNLSVGVTYSVYVVVTDTLGNSTKSNTIEIRLADNYMITTGTNKQYKPTLADAISVSKSNSTITLLNSIEDNSTVTIDGITNLTIDLNGYTLTRDQSITITSTATVEFIGEGYIQTKNNSTNTAIINGGNCTINFDEDNGIVHETYYPSRSAIQNIGTLLIKSGKIEEERYGLAIELSANSTLTMDGGEVLYGYAGIYAQGSDISITINDGLIESNGTYSSSYGVYFGYSSNNKLAVNGGKIISNTYSAIYSCYSSNITIEIFGGLVSGKKYGIEVGAQFITQAPEVIVGNVNNTYDKQAVTVVGGEHAMYLDTRYIKAFNVYFYNGILKTTSVENEVLSGAYIQEVRDSYSIMDEKDITSHNKYLTDIGTSKMYAIEDKLYNTLGEAVEAAVDGDTIVLLKSGTDSSKAEIINKNITLLLNTYTLTKTTNTINIGLNGSMTVTGNNSTFKNQNIIGFTLDGEVKMYGKVNVSTTSSSYPIFDTDADGAIIDINNGNLTASGSKTRIVNIDNKATCYIRGLASITLSNSSYGIYNSSNGGILRLENGMITVNSSYGIYNDSNMECYIMGTDMEINTSSYAIYNSRTSLGKIYNKYENSFTTINLNAANSMGIYNESGSNVEIKFNEHMYIFDNSYDKVNTENLTGAAIYNAGSGDIEISAGVYRGIVYGIKNTGSGNITIKNGKVSEYYIAASKDYAGILNTSTGKITIEGGYVEGSNVCIYNTGNTSIEIKGGEIGSYNAYHIQQYYAIYNTNANASITIGDIGKSVSTSQPIIICENTSKQAIYTNSSKLYFYNGRIENGNATMYNRTPNIRAGYKINRENKTYKDGNDVNRTKYIEYLVEDPNYKSR